MLVSVNARPPVRAIIAPMVRGEVRHDDGTTIAYDVTGAGPPVVFVHGLTNRRQGWDPVTALLAARFTCVRLDLRGHGESSTASDYGMPSLVGDVRAVVEDLALTDPAVIGHSLGASVAGVYAAVHDTRAVVCVDQSLRFGDFAEQIQPLAGDLRGEHPMEAVMDFERGLQLEPYAGIAELERRVLAFDPAVVLGIWARALDAPPRELTAVSEALLPQVDAPVLCLHGSPPPQDYAAWLTALAPRARVEVWDGMGHLLHLVDPQRFAARVTELLDP
jgi:pimeloyl-ACP methyl ester carboxylesterase